MNIFRAVSILFLAILTASCKNTDVVTSGTSPTGTLFGYVTLTDARGRAVVDKSGVNVSPEGTPFSAMTDTSGKWTLYNLPTSTYNLNFAKSGYNTFKNTSYGFIGGGMVKYFTSQKIAQSPNFTVMLDGFVAPKYTTDAQGRKIFGGNGSIYAHTSDDTPDSASIYFKFILSRNPNLDINDPTSYDIISTTNTSISYLNHDAAITLNLNSNDNSWSNLFMNKFASGETVYLKAYPVLSSSYMSYYDVFLDKTINVGYGKASNVLSTVAP